MNRRLHAMNVSAIPIIILSSTGGTWLPRRNRNGRRKTSRPEAMLSIYTDFSAKRSKYDVVHLYRIYIIYIREWYYLLFPLLLCRYTAKNNGSQRRLTRWPVSIEKHTAAAGATQHFRSLLLTRDFFIIINWYRYTYRAQTFLLLLLFIIIIIVTIIIIIIISEHILKNLYWMAMCRHNDKGLSQVPF